MFFISILYKNMLNVDLDKVIDLYYINIFNCLFCVK